jgi:hypothetical protein
MRLLDMSLVCAPHNAACRYHRAYLLFARERHDEALAELNKLKLIAPLEAQVFFLAGKVCWLLGLQNNDHCFTGV